MSKRLKLFTGSMVWAFGVIALFCMPSFVQAATKNMWIKTSSEWFDTGISVSQGTEMVAKTNKILRLGPDAGSVNSNGEWLYCWNKRHHNKFKSAITNSARKLPSAPVGAVIFKIGKNGKPFFVPREGGSPGKNMTPVLGVDRWQRLPGWSSWLKHVFTAKESGRLYVGINLAKNNRRNWNWYSYKLSFSIPTEREITGKIVDENNRVISNAEVWIEKVTAKKRTDRNGKFKLIVKKNGNYSVKAARTGYEQAEKKVEIKKIGEVNLGNLILKSKPGTIIGNVQDEKRKPVKEATITVTKYDYKKRKYVEVKSVSPQQPVTDKTGKFKLKLNAGSYRIIATKLSPTGSAEGGRYVRVYANRVINVRYPIRIKQGMHGYQTGCKWMPTGTTLKKGQAVELAFSGRIYHYRFRRWYDRIGRKGVKPRAGAPLRNGNCGTIIAKVGEKGRPFAVGKGGRFDITDSGKLFFGINVSNRERVWVKVKSTKVKILEFGDIAGKVIASAGKPVEGAIVRIPALKKSIETDSLGKFNFRKVPSERQKITVFFPGYKTESVNILAKLAQTVDAGEIKLTAVSTTGEVKIKIVPENGVTGGIVPVFVEVTNTSSQDALFGGYLISLKAESKTGKIYKAMSPTYLILNPKEKRGTELLWRVDKNAAQGDYNITAELRVAKAESIHQSAQQFRARRDLLDKLKSFKDIKGKIISSDRKAVKIVKGAGEIKIADKAKLLLPTITPKIFSPQKGQIVTGKIVLREDCIVILGKKIQIFEDKNGEPLTVWNNYEAYHMAQERGERKDDWVWIGQSDDKSNDFAVTWDTTKMQDGDYLIKATMRTNYDGKPIEGSMTVMCKLRNNNKTGGVEGKIVDEDGKSVKGVIVRREARTQEVTGVDWATTQTKSNVGWSAEDVVKTDNEGKFLFADVLSGEYRLKISGENFADTLKQIKLKPGQKLSMGEVRVRSNPGSITGAVKCENGESAKGSSVRIKGTEAFVKTGEDGKFEFKNLKKGAHEIVISKDKFVEKTTEALLAAGQILDIGEIILSPKFGTVVGVVKISEDKGLSGVKVEILESAFVTNSDEEGRFEFSEIPAGPAKLKLSMDVYETIEKEIDIFSGQVNDTGEIVLRKLIGSIAGQVKDGKGNAIAGVKVTAGEVGAETDEDGEFLIEGLKPADYELTASKDGFNSETKAITVEAFKETELDFQLKKTFGGIKGQVVGKDGKGIDEVEISIKEPPLSVMTVFVSRMDPGFGQIGGKNGIFEMGDIPTGKREIVFAHPLYKDKTVEKEIKNGQKIELGKIKLEKDTLNIGTLAGKVTDDRGKPVNKASIIVTDLEPELLVTSDGAGKFKVADLPKGKHSISVAFPGFKIEKINVNIPGAGTKQINIKLKRSGLEKATGKITVIAGPHQIRTGVPASFFVDVENTMPATDNIPVPYYLEITAKNRKTGKEFKHLAPTVISVNKGQHRQAKMHAIMPLAATDGEYDFTTYLMTGKINAQDVTKSKPVEITRVSGKYDVVKGLSKGEVKQALQLILPTITPKIISPKKGKIVTGEIKISEWGLIGWGNRLETVNKNAGAPVTVTDMNGNKWQVDNITNKYWHRRYDPKTGKKADWLWIGESSLFGNNFEVGWDTSKLIDGDYEIRARMTAIVGQLGANNKVINRKPISGDMIIRCTVRNRKEPGALKGKIFDDAGKPVAEVLVKRSDRADIITGIDKHGKTISHKEWAVREVVRTDANGGYEFRNMAEGSYIFSFEGEGYGRIDDRQVNVMAGKVSEISKVTVKPLLGSIAGSVSDEDDSALKGVEVRAAGRKTITGADGRYSIKDIRPGKYDVFFSKVNYTDSAVYNPYKRGALPQLKNPVTPARVNPGKETGLPQKMYVMPGKVKGKITDKEDNAVQGVKIRLSRDDKDFLVTKADGMFISGAVKPGMYKAVFEKNGYQEKVADVKVSASEELNLGNIVMKLQTGEITGTVDPAAAAVELAGFGKGSGKGFSFKGLKPGDHTLKVSAPNHKSATVKEKALPGEVTTVRIKLEPLPGIIKGAVKTTDGAALSGVELRIGGKKRALTDAKGVYEIKDNAPGPYVIEFHKKGYELRSKKIKVKPGRTLTVSMIMKELPAAITGKVNPADAAVKIGDKKVKVKKGVYSIEAKSGKYELKASKKGFKSFSKQIIVEPGAKATVDIDLKTAMAKLRFKVNPSDSKVLIDGVKTPVRAGAVSAELKDGKHEIAIFKKGYVDVKKEITIAAGKVSDIGQIKLTMEYVQITARISPADADVTLDGRAVKLKKSAFQFGLAKEMAIAEFTKDVLPGEHSIVVSKKGYEVYKKSFNVKAGEPMQLAVNLVKLAGSVAGTVSPGNAVIEIDGKEVTVTGGKFSVSLDEGKYRIAASAEGYIDRETEADVKPGERTVVKITLRQKNGGLNIVVTPADSRVWLNNKPLKVNEDGLYGQNLKPGEYVIKAAREGYFETSRKIKIESDKAVVSRVKLTAKPVAVSGRVWPLTAVKINGKSAKFDARKKDMFAAGVPAGKITLEASKEGFEAVKKEINAEPGTAVEINLALKPNPVTLTGKVVAQDGKPLKGAVLILTRPMPSAPPWIMRIQVMPEPLEVVTSETGQFSFVALWHGKYSVTVGKNGYKSVTQKMEFFPGDSKELKYVLAAKPSYLFIKCMPASALVQIDGKVVKFQGSKAKVQLKAGAHKIKASKDKFQNYEQDINIDIGETKSIEIKLLRKPAKLPLNITKKTDKAMIGQSAVIEFTTLANADVEISAIKGEFAGSKQKVEKGRTDKAGGYKTSWQCWEPGDYTIKIKITKSSDKLEKSFKIKIAFVPPEIEIRFKKILGDIKLGKPVKFETEIKNKGNVSGKYRIEARLRGRMKTKSSFNLKPIEVDLKPGENKKLNIDWKVLAIGEYSLSMKVYMITGTGSKKLVKTTQYNVDMTLQSVMEGKIQVIGNKVYFVTKSAGGAAVKYEVAQSRQFGLKKLDGKKVSGRCKILYQLRAKGVIAFKEPPQVKR